MTSGLHCMITDNNDDQFFTYKVWMGLHNNYPHIVNREITYDDLCNSKEWLNDNKINFVCKISDKGYTRNSNSTFNVKFRFHNERDALLFNLRG